MAKVSELTHYLRNTTVIGLISAEARAIIGDRMQIYRIGYPKYPLNIPQDPTSTQCCQNYCKDCVYTKHGTQMARFSAFVDEHARDIDMTKEGNLVVSCSRLHKKFTDIVFG